MPPRDPREAESTPASGPRDAYPSVPSMPGTIVRMPEETEAVEQLLEDLGEETQPKSLKYGSSLR